MQTRQGNMLESLETVQRFLEDHAERLGEVVTSGARTSLQQAIDELAGYRADQAEGSAATKVSTQVQRSLRQVLLEDHMAVVSRIARAALPVVAQVPSLRIPRGTPSTARLAHAAYEMAEAAEQHASVFTNAGLPAEFGTQMKAAADALLLARADHSHYRARKGGATEGLKAKLAAGRRTVQVLDAMVKTVLRREPALIAEWNLARRVARVPGGAGVVAVVEPGIGQAA